MTKLRVLYRYMRKALEAWAVIGKELGWKRSFMSGRPVDGEGKAIPWYTYPAIEFLKSLDLSKSRVFEYGCGNSSIFWAQRSNAVFAVENNAEWAHIVRDLNVPGLTVIEAVDRNAYIGAAETVGGEFDVVIVDGRFRRACVQVASKVVHETGMIIFDNADWYPDACDDLREHGWFQIDFSGLGPINPYAWTTAVFLKTPVAFQRLSNVSPVGGNPQGRHA
jgi:hypothetical protein